ncbi:hypothetical protein BDR26DRAFT_865499, partial [Obelidium mucronatum]
TGEHTQPLRHYCFVAQITEVSFVNRPRITVSISPTETAIIESSSRSSPTTFAWPDLKPGNTIAIMYATKRILSDGVTLGIRQDDLSFVYLFRSKLAQLVSYATKWTCKPRECFHSGCSRKTMLIVCAQSPGAVYCCNGHQLEGMVKEQHRNLFSQTKDLSWLLEAVNAGFYSKYAFMDL